MITNVDGLLGNPSNVPSGIFTNAEQIKGVPVDDVAIGDGKVLTYDNVNGKLIYKEISTVTNWGTILGDIETQTDLQLALHNKVDKLVGKGLSTNDYSDTDEAKLLSLRTNAEVDILLDTKVDKVVGKGLSTNNLTNELKGQYDTTVLNSHTHTNKTLLDSLVSNGDGSKYLSNDGTYKTVSSGGGVDSFVELNDTPNTYVGQENKYVKVNSTADGLEFVVGGGTGGATSFTDLDDVPISYVGQANKMVTVNDSETGLDFTTMVAIPTKTSDLTNDSNFVVDSSYVHTDNNFTSAKNSKLLTIENYAEVNVQSDWNEVSNAVDSYIKNKPSIIDNALTIANPTLSYIVKDNSLEEFTGGGASTFLDLTDTPTTYVGSESKVVSVKSDGSGLEFTTSSGGSSYPIIRQKFLVDGEVTFSCTGLTYTPSYTAPNKNHLIIFEYADYYELMFNFYGKFSTATITGSLSFSASFLLPTSIIVNDDPYFPICYGTINESVTNLIGTISYNRSTRSVFANMQIGTGLVNAKTSTSLLIVTNHTFVGTLKIYKNPLSTWTW